MERNYLSESHRKHSEALGKEIEEMSKHPMSREQMKAQCDRILEESEKAKKK